MPVLLLLAPAAEDTAYRRWRADSAGISWSRFNREWLSLYLLFLPLRVLVFWLDHLVIHPHWVAWIAAIVIGFLAYWVHEHPREAREWLDKNILGHSAVRAKWDSASRWLNGQVKSN